MMTLGAANGGLMDDAIDSSYSTRPSDCDYFFFSIVAESSVSLDAEFTDLRTCSLPCFGSWVS